MSQQFYSQQRPNGSGFGRNLFKSSPAVFSIIAISVGVFILQMFSSFIHQIGAYDPITFYLGLNPALIINKFFLWQFVTYLFTHGGFFHLFFNMFALFFLGRRLEILWGGKEFVKYYLITGVFAGLCSFALALLSALKGQPIAITIGASGSIYALLLAFGMIWPNEKLYIWGVLPIKAKYLVIILGAIELFMQIGGKDANVAHLAHLGGLLAGFLYIIINAKVYHKRKLNEKIIDLEEFVKRKQHNEAVDIILDKVIESGIDSLTPAEKQKLIDAGHYFKNFDN